MIPKLVKSPAKSVTDCHSSPKSRSIARWSSRYEGLGIDGERISAEPLLRLFELLIRVLRVMAASPVPSFEIPDLRLVGLDSGEDSPFNAREICTSACGSEWELVGS